MRGGFQIIDLKKKPIIKNSSGITLVEALKQVSNPDGKATLLTGRALLASTLTVSTFTPSDVQYLPDEWVNVTKSGDNYVMTTSDNNTVTVSKTGQVTVTGA